MCFDLKLKDGNKVDGSLGYILWKSGQRVAQSYIARWVRKKLEKCPFGLTKTLKQGHTQAAYAICCAISGKKKTRIKPV